MKRAWLARLGRCPSQCQRIKPRLGTCSSQPHCLEAIYALFRSNLRFSTQWLVILQSIMSVTLNWSFDIASCMITLNLFFPTGLNFALFIITIFPLRGATPAFYCLHMVFWDIMLGNLRSFIMIKKVDPLGLYLLQHIVLLYTSTCTIKISNSLDV